MALNVSHPVLFGVVVILCDLLLMDEVVDQRHQVVRLENVFPQVGDLMTIGVDRVLDVFVEREEPDLVSLQLGRHRYLLVTHCKVDKTSLELEQRLSGISILSVLFLGICHHLVRQAVLQFHHH